MPGQSALQPTAAPVTTRIHSLDVIRGFALLGILLMNIQSFAMPEAAYLNPTAYGDFGGINKAIWLVSHLLADGKFMAIFSMLFGAGTVLFCQRLEAGGINSFRLHYRRMFWLLIFGLLHAHFIWYGDILFHYAVCGFIIYFARNWPALRLMSMGLVLLFIGWLMTAIPQISLAYMSQELLAELRLDWAPSAQQIAAEISDYTGSWQAQFSHRSESALYMESVVLLYMGWRVMGLMLMGMALYKQGLFSSEQNAKTLQRRTAGFLAVGLVFVGYGAAYNLQHDFQMEYALFTGTQFNYVGSVLLALGYLYLLNWLTSRQQLRFMLNKLALVGRMAFTNYISQSIICTFIFYGIGLGLFGAVERWQQLLIVVVVWLIQISLSSLWLSIYHSGPLEWLWRRLTYNQAMR